MIERLENCPNCGAILDDLGRCNFCGSKVYDLFDIDVSGNHGVKYLRVKTDRGILLAPIVCNSVEMKTRHVQNYALSTFEGGRYKPYLFDTIIGMEFRVIGEMIYERSDE